MKTLQLSSLVCFESSSMSFRIIKLKVIRRRWEHRKLASIINLIEISYFIRKMKRENKFDINLRRLESVYELSKKLRCHEILFLMKLLNRRWGDELQQRLYGNFSSRSSRAINCSRFNGRLQFVFAKKFWNHKSSPWCFFDDCDDGGENFFLSTNLESYIMCFWLKQVSSGLI